MLSESTPAWHIPVTSPLTSAMNTGTPPACEKPSAITFKRNRFARAGSAGDKAVTVCLIEQQVAGIVALRHPNSVVLKHGVLLESELLESIESCAHYTSGVRSNGSFAYASTQLAAPSGGARTRLFEPQGTLPTPLPEPPGSSQ